MTTGARSIRLRLLVFAFAGTLVALGIAGIGLVALFDRHLERRLGQELDTHIAQIGGNLRIGPDGELTIASEPADPRFNRLFSGLYWQVRDEEKGTLLRSVSLWDSALVLPDDNLPPGETHSHDIGGPAKSDLLLHETRFRIADNRGGTRTVRVSVAVSRAEAEQLTTGFARDILPALGLLGFALLAGAWLQVGAGLAPFTAVQRGIRDVRAGSREHLDSDVPTEIEPLVEEVNSLLDQQTADMQRARDRAADLAHGLKTPLTALGADISALRARGEDDVANSIETLAQEMHRTVERELARSRLRNRRTGMPGVAVKPTVEAIARTLARTPAGKEKKFRIDGPASVAVLADRDDIHDILGNLMENATRFARTTVSVEIATAGGDVTVTVSDDGAGVELDDINSLIKRGSRHDQKGGSAGLGLAIVGDILAAYGREPEFMSGTMGGLAVRFALPASVSAT